MKVFVLLALVCCVHGQGQTAHQTTDAEKIKALEDVRSNFLCNILFDHAQMLNDIYSREQK
jgi:hypothetical protein